MLICFGVFAKWNRVKYKLYLCARATVRVNTGNAIVEIKVGPSLFSLWKMDLFLLPVSELKKSDGMVDDTSMPQPDVFF